jgi:pimeloyl-ACP methyl ester carboxylesterase
MMERMFYFERPTGDDSRRLFCHGFVSEQAPAGVAFVVLNGFLDRMGDRHLRALQADLARVLAGCGCEVYHLDYFGTGDSYGETHEMDFEESCRDVAHVVDTLRASGGRRHVVLFGVRLGADLALRLAESRPDLEHLVLVEPVVDGRLFYKSRLFLRKSAHLLYDIHVDLDLEIDGQQYDDFDGVPVSRGLKQALLGLKVEGARCAGKNILLYSLAASPEATREMDIITDKREIESLRQSLSAANRVRFGMVPMEGDGQDLVRCLAPDVVQFVRLLQSVPPGASRKTGNAGIGR